MLDSIFLSPFAILMYFSFAIEIIFAIVLGWWFWSMDVAIVTLIVVGVGMTFLFHLPEWYVFATIGIGILWFLVPQDYGMGMGWYWRPYEIYKAIKGKKNKSA